jgi:SAM-dependent methyltransferase
VTEPRSSSSEIRRFYPAQYNQHRARRRGASAGMLSALGRRKVDLMLRFGSFRRVVSTEPGRLLDVGCGRGAIAAGFVRLGWKAFGIEPSPAAVDAAVSLGVEGHVGTIETAPWAPRGFDLVLFHHSLEHIDDPVAALRRATEFLRPDGRILVVVPDWGSRQRRLFGSKWFHLDLPRHLQHFDRNSLDVAFSTAGLLPLTSSSSISASGFFGSLQYTLVGHCLIRGKFTPIAQMVWIVLYPLTLIAGKLLGGDTLFLIGRPREPAVGA